MLVFGGSLGARSINEAAIEAFADAPFRVLHACGARDYESLRARIPGPHYDLRPYIDDFGEALLASDLCVARSGGSIFEVAAHGRPAVLVPYPYAAGDHQAANARWMADAGAAVVIPDAELDSARLAHEVGALLGRRRRGSRRWPTRRRRSRDRTRHGSSPGRCWRAPTRQLGAERPGKISPSDGCASAPRG